MSATGEEGFTLLEMLVVLALVGLASGLVFPSFKSMIAVSEFNRAAADVALSMREARAKAIRTGSPVALSVMSKGQAFAISGSTPRDVPRAVSLRAGGPIRFMTDGSSSGGTVRVERGPRQATLRVAPATGRVTIEKD